MEKKKRYWPDSSVRAKRWRAKQGKAVLTISTRRWLRFYKKRPNERTRRLGSWSEVASHTAFHRHREEAGRLESAQKLVSKEQGNPLQGSSICLTNRVLTS